MKRIIIAALVIVASALAIPTARADDPTCAPGEEWQGEFGCVAVQLPEETNGRAIDCPDGSVGYMQDGRVECPPPAVVVEPDPAPGAAPAPQPPTAAPAPQPPAAAPVAPAPVATPVDDVATFDVVTFVRDLFARIFGWLFA